MAVSYVGCGIGAELVTIQTRLAQGAGTLPVQIKSAHERHVK